MTETALVTGAGSGLGRLVARRLAAAGARVAALDVDGEALAMTARRSPPMSTHVVDVTDQEAVTTVVARVERDFGRIDRLVHAAGLCHPGAVLEQPASSLRRVWEVNSLGTVHVCQAVVPGMVRAGAGEVVLFGSLSGWLPSPRLAAYSASKSAVAAYAEVLAQEIDDTGVRVLCVCPGQVETPLAEGVRAVDPAALGGRAGMSPERVVDAAERALHRRRPPLFVFPGPSAPIWLARRLAPGLLRAVVARAVRPSS